MPNFFHNIRRRLLKENRFIKYLQYAVGEIILVVIGILIALYINNYNQEKKTERRVVAILEEVQHDLEKNIRESDIMLDFYEEQDSLVYLVIEDKLTPGDYYGNSYARTLLTAVKHMKIYTNGYNNLTGKTDEIPKKYRHLLRPLNELYVYQKYEVDKFDDRMNLLTDHFHDDFAAKPVVPGLDIY